MYLQTDIEPLVRPRNESSRDVDKRYSLLLCSSSELAPLCPFHSRHALDVRIDQDALECLLDEKAELAAHAAALETRLHEAEAAAAAAAAAAAEAGSRPTFLPAEEGVPLEPGRVAREGQTADLERGGDGRADETRASHTSRAAEETTPQHQPQQERVLLHHQPQQELFLRQSRAEADRLRGELENARSEQARAAAAAAEERQASARRVAELEAAVEQTRREYQDHRDRAESRLETLRVAFDQENEENDPQVRN